MSKRAGLGLGSVLVALVLMLAACGPSLAVVEVDVTGVR